MAKSLSTVSVRLKYIKASILTVLIFGVSPRSFGWGMRGHSLICEAAIHRLKNPELKRYLIARTLNLQYLCNLPDIYWRSLQEANAGTPTHFFEPDIINLRIEDIPLEYSLVEKQALRKMNQNTRKPILDPAKELGSSWWRADQFVRLAIEAGKKASSSQEPKDRSDFIYKMTAMMGLLGHFVGDNAQPLHSTRNFDGWENQHGGLHGYYESDLVNEFSERTLEAIIQAIPQAETELELHKKRSTLENMKILAKLSYKDLPRIFELDSFIKASSIKRERGLELKTVAERKSPAQTHQIFEFLLTSEMARAAALLAHEWERIYTETSHPNLKEEHSFRFPHQYEYVAPDYL